MFLLSWLFMLFFFSSRRRHTRCLSDWSSDVCSSDLGSSREFCCSAIWIRRSTSRTESRYSVTRSLSLGPTFFCKAPSCSLTKSRMLRSEERRVGKEWRAGGGQDHVDK